MSRKQTKTLSKMSNRLSNIWAKHSIRVREKHFSIFGSDQYLWLLGKPILSVWNLNFTCISILLYILHLWRRDHKHKLKRIYGGSSLRLRNFLIQQEVICQRLQNFCNTMLYHTLQIQLNIQYLETSAVKNGQQIWEINWENFCKQMYSEISRPNYSIGTPILRRGLDSMSLKATIWPE